MQNSTQLCALLAASALAPLTACAQTITATDAVVLTVYGLIGATGALSILVMICGFIVYIIRLGTERRSEGIHIMEWGVALVITSIVLIAILHLLGNWLGLAT